MDKYIIQGGEKLYGQVRLQSAKNAVLPLILMKICAIILMKIKFTEVYYANANDIPLVWRGQ